MGVRGCRVDYKWIPRLIFVAGDAVNLQLFQRAMQDGYQ
jgi:hypothetical protein